MGARRIAAQASGPVRNKRRKHRTPHCEALLPGTGALALLAAAFLLGSGGAVRAADGALGQVQAVAVQRTGATVADPGSGGADQAVADAITCMLEGTLTRDEAVQIALLNNRRLQARLSQLGIACGDLVEAGLLKNPIFEYVRRKSKEPMTVDNIEWSVTLDFIDILLLPLRRKLAASEFEQVKLEVAADVLELAFDVQSAWYDMQAAVESLELYRTAVEATKASYETAVKIHEAGNISDLELHQEQAIYEEQKLALQEAETDGIELRERLNLLMGLWGPCTNWKMGARLPRLPKREVAGAGLESVAVCQRLDLAAARQEIESLGRELGIANATSLIPELEGGYAAERETDGTWLRGYQFSLPIPIFNQGQGPILRNRARLAQAQHNYYAQAVEVRSEVRSARARMMKARERVNFYEKIMLPLRTRMVEEALLQFNAMDVSPFELLQIKRDQVNAGAETIGALRDYWTARSELEKALGGSLECRAAGGAGAPVPPPERLRHEHGRHGVPQTAGAGSGTMPPPPGSPPGSPAQGVERPVAGQVMEARGMWGGRMRGMRQEGNGQGVSGQPPAGHPGPADGGTATGAAGSGGAGGGAAGSAGSGAAGAAGAGGGA